MLDSDFVWSVEIDSWTENWNSHSVGSDANYIIDKERNHLIPIWCSNQGVDGEDALCHIFKINIEDGSLVSKHSFAWTEFDSEHTFSGYSSMVIVGKELLIWMESTWFISLTP